MRRSLASVALLLAAPLGAQSSPLTPHQQLARSVYEELVEINTVDSVGNVTTAARAMAKRFRDAGFPASDVQVLVPPNHPDKGNLVVRYHGRAPNGSKPILLLAHLDVVAANRADWPRDPFTLHEENGYFLGRGTSDDKAMAAIFVANMLDWKKEGWVPERDVVLALTADEEGGPANGAEWLATEHKPLIDAAYAINEGGGGTLTPDGKPLFHSIQATEKVYTDYTFTVTNPGGHSSVPRPDNAIYQLAEALGRVQHYTFPVALNPITRGFFEQTAKVETRPEMAAAMRALAANPADATAAATLSKDDRYASMLRTSCVATRLAGGHANNALPQRATANVNCRIAPTSTSLETLAALQRAVGDTGVKIEIVGAPRVGATPSAIDPGLLGAVTSLTKQTWGDIPVIPTMSTGATDGRPLRAAGIPTYGVSGLFSVPGEGNAHGRDEKLRVKSFYDGLSFLDQLVRRVAGSPKA
ncbi:M20/M25/M40 family metallo-hydrolase [Gemmatirosa kalamazoonensis]|nr:M20/M25/M40 family metallo-hydrolase [Gemmatirosa kalamazoonensis]